MPLGPTIVDATLADPQELAALIEEAYGAEKCRFLTEHGDWWYRGSRRLVILQGGSVAAYHAFIPTTCLVEGKELPASWAVDLYVALRFRGQGLQRVITDRAHEIASTHLAFANDLSADIYRRQRGGRVRSDLAVLLLPLQPRHVGSVERATGLRSALLRAGALGMSPLAAAYRMHAARFQPRFTEVIGAPDPSVLEGIFRMYASDDIVTTVRSSAFLSWRYLDAPYRSQLVFYVTGKSTTLTHYAIVRYMMSNGRVRGRILDIFGDLGDQEGAVDLLRTVARDAVLRGATHVTAMASIPQLAHCLRRVGFILQQNANFCWTSRDPRVQERLFQAPLYWTLGDSDNDEPPRSG